MKIAKVEGEVVVKDGSGLRVEFYEREFELDDVVKDEGTARAVIRKALVADELRRSVEGYKRVRTMQVVSLESRDGAKAGGELDKLVVRALEMDAVPENLEKYGSVESKERAVRASIERVEVAKRRKAKRVREVEVVDEGYVD
jgi:hypothetical protein